VVFGDMKRYLIRRVRDLSVLTLRERFADYNQVGFLGFARYDGSPLYAGSGTAFPFALLQNSY
jgi:HK97 family phage major capsid protein